MKTSNIHEVDIAVINDVAEQYDALKPTGDDGNPNGYDDAIIGITDNGQLVYSKEWMVKILSENGMDEDEAWEYLEYNCFDAYVGEQTPIFVNTYQVWQS